MSGTKGQGPGGARFSLLPGGRLARLFLPLKGSLAEDLCRFGCAICFTLYLNSRSASFPTNVASVLCSHFRSCRSWTSLRCSSAAFSSEGNAAPHPASAADALGSTAGEPAFGECLSGILMASRGDGVPWWPRLSSSRDPDVLKSACCLLITLRQQSSV